MLLLVTVLFMSSFGHIANGASFKGTTELESNVKEIRQLLLDQTHEKHFNELKHLISLQSNSLNRFDVHLENLHQSAKIWSTYEHYITSWMDQISAVDRKLDIVIKSQEKLNVLESKLNTVNELITKFDFDKWEHLANKLESIQKTDVTSNQSSKTNDIFTLIDEYTTRGVLSSLNRIESKLYEPSPNESNINITCGEYNSNITEFFEDIASKVDVIVDKMSSVSLQVPDPRIEIVPTRIDHFGEEEENPTTPTTRGNGCNTLFTDWMLIHRRHNAVVAEYSPDPMFNNNFNRSWSQYKEGFSSHEGSWIGNEELHRLSKCFDLKLRIELWDFEDNFAWAEYKHFAVSDEEDNYRLEISGYTGNATDSFSSHNGVPFSTYDVNNDEAPDCCPCAVTYGSGWWFNKCFEANLNGLFHDDPTDIDYYNGIIWEGWLGNYSLKRVEMFIRVD